jgi:hypothetical protein
MWVKPKHNATVTIRITAITPKYPDFCRTNEMLPHLNDLQSTLTSTRMIARRLSNVAHSEPAVATATSQELYWLDEGSLFYY